MPDRKPRRRLSLPTPMLCPGDLHLARRDPALPGLATVLDPDAFARLLRWRVPRLDLKSVRAVYVRYKPGTSCLVSYEVQTPHALVHVHANTYTVDRATDMAADAGGIAGSRRRRADIIADQGIVISVFPDDHGLRTLARIWEPGGVSDVLRKLLPDLPAFWHARLSVRAYKPGRRCVAALTAADGATAILKAHTASGFPQAAAGARAFCSNGTLAVARVLGRSRRHKLLAFEWLPGDRLAEMVREGRAGVECLRRVGAALASLHNQHGGDLRHPDPAGVADELEAVARGVGWLSPPSADRAARLAVDLAARLRDTTSVSLHGDFDATQVLVGDGTVGVVDMDRARRGDPRVDVANFIAHLERDTLDSKVESDVAQRLRDALIEGYEETVQQSLRGGLESYVAAALLRLAPSPFRTRQRDWPERLAAILGRAESLLGRAGSISGRRSTASIVCDPFGVLADRELALPETVLDPAAMSGRLAQLAVGSGRPIEVRAVRVSRLKPGRRCLIEYDLAVSGGTAPERTQTLIAKARAKGADWRAYRLSRALWRNGFQDDSADGVSIPRPLGVLPDLKMWIQLKAAGTPLTNVLAEGGGAELGRRVADAIRKLHCHQQPVARHHGIEDELQILRGRLRIVPDVIVERKRLDAVFDQCARLAVTLRCVSARGVHRDFYADQVLYGGGRLYLLDLDLYAAGDPALDVGNFLGHISEYSLRVFGNPARLTEFETAMTRRFLTLDQTVSAGRIEIYKTLTLARLIQISTVIPERRPFTRKIVTLVESRLHQHVASGNPAGDMP